MSEITEINHRALAQAMAFFKQTAPRAPVNLMLLSPSIDDVAFVKQQFPGSRLLVATRDTWDLNQAFPGSGGVDLVLASNVFHYSPDPGRWFSNVLAMTRYFILQDLIFRRRSTAPDGLCNDGDAVRYSFHSRGVESAFAAAYDLSRVEATFEMFSAFDGGRNEHHTPPLPPPKHYCAVIRSVSPSAERPPLHGAAYWRYRLPALGYLVRLGLRRALGGQTR